MKPLISVYTPTYNRTSLLRQRAFPSVLNQTYDNWEWIIVHDGKHDLLRRIVESYDDDRIRYYDIDRVEPEHDYDTERQWYIGGTYPANFALDKVRGDWIARLDDDDCWSYNHLERSLEFIVKGDYDFITSQYVILKDDNGILFNCPNVQEFLRIHDPTLSNCKVGCHSSWFYKAELKEFKYDPECYKKEWNRINDVDLLERLFRAGVKMGFLAECLTTIAPHSNEKEVGYKALMERMK